MSINQKQILFFKDNHLSGSAVSTIRLGLEYNDELVACVSFGKSRYNKDYEWEIIRFASKQNLTVIGGFQKLLSKFRQENTGTIFTYADRRHSTGNVYIKAGFENLGSTDPGYVWTNGTVTYSRYETQKSKLHKILTDVDLSKTEEWNMFNAKYKKYFDCGHLKFGLK